MSSPPPSVECIGLVLDPKPSSAHQHPDGLHGNSLNISIKCHLNKDNKGSVPICDGKQHSGMASYPLNS